ncbi:GM15551 [Drosophila sechellia]|uniref:GM15551 n=1 Tax=Drosophila sechellia TaxID=7238 RepID=B4I8L5_DROSE|nr:GM15551 [Drosophila sechellia]
MKFIAAGLALLVCSIQLGEGALGKLLDSSCATTRAGITPLIIGGASAAPFSNPWMVKVIGTKLCGGSLITSRFVLTAAHCIVPTHMRVHLGDYYTLVPGTIFSSSGCVPTAYELAVDTKIVHADFNADLDNDIGLLRMESFVQYSDYVQPICILVEGHMTGSSHFNITGWGKTDDANSSLTLQQATVFKTELYYCQKKYPSKKVDESQICAASTNSDVCSGDSGGPLSAQVSFVDRLLTFQYGVVSYGSKECNSFSVYTNVTHHRDWIVDAIKHFSGSLNLGYGSYP